MAKKEEIKKVRYNFRYYPIGGFMLEDAKPENFGLIKGKLVKVDYGVSYIENWI